MIDICCRERSPYSIQTHPSRLSVDCFYCIYGPGLDMLHEPARAGSFESFRCQLVVLVGDYRTRLRCYSQRQMGWTIHDCMGGQSHSRPLVGFDRRHQNHNTCKSHTAHLLKGILIEVM